MEPDDDYDDDEYEPRPPGRQEAALIRRDIDDLAAFRETFEPEGYKGVSLYCDDCSEEHYYGWDMLEGNLRSLLESGDYPVHEPPYDPKPEEYVNWEYAQGYVDGLSDAGATIGPPPRLAGDVCPYCSAALPPPVDHVVYCPTCGIHLGPARIASALLGRGWSEQDVAELLRASHVPPPAGSRS